MTIYLTTAARKDVKSCTEVKPFAWMSADGARILSVHRRRDLVKGLAEPTIVITAKEAREIKANRDRDHYVMIVATHDGQKFSSKQPRLSFDGIPFATISSYSNHKRNAQFFSTQERAEQYAAEQRESHTVDPTKPWTKHNEGYSITVVPATIKEIA